MPIPQYVKFPNAMLGSCSKRSEIVKSLNKKFFNDVTNKGEKASISCTDIINEYKKFLPGYNINVENLATKGARGAAGMYWNNLNEPTRFFTELPFDKCKLYKKDYKTMMHENTHILNHLTNPKYTARLQKIHSNSNFSFYKEFYSKHLYCCENTPLMAMIRVKKETYKFLKKLTPEEQIDFLQEARYRLQNELDAYTEGLKYTKKQTFLERIFSDTVTITNPDKEFMFSRKINFLKQKILKIIQKERANLNTKNNL